MYYIGYCRVSSRDNRQSIGLEVQKSALAFCDELIVEKASGYEDNRKGLKKALKRAKEQGQNGPVTLCVYRLDRLTRRMFYLSDLMHVLNKNNICLMSLQEHIETDTLTGRLLLIVLGYVAEMELDNIRKRTKDGLQKAREMGITLGRPAYPLSLQVAVCKAYLTSSQTVKQIANRHNISRATVYRILEKQGIPRSRRR